MRRLALLLIASCGVALIVACSGGGSGFSINSSTDIDNIAFSNGSAQVNDFFLAPSGNAPLSVTAIGYKGAGAFATIVPNVFFTWTANIVNPAVITPPTYDTTVTPPKQLTFGVYQAVPYIFGAAPSGQHFCGLPFSPAAVPPPPATSTPLPTVPIFADVNATTPLQPGQGVQQVFLKSVAGVPTNVAPVGGEPIPLPTTLTANTATTSSNSYCVNLTATAPNGKAGGITVVVSNAP